MKSFLIGVFIVAVSIAVFGQVGSFQFTTFDDNVYIRDNPHIRQGLTWEGIKWSLGADLFFKAHHADYWQPVTFFSRMVDVSLFGLNAGGHHLMNLFFHIVNALFLFYLLKRMTGSLWRSAIAAFLFAVHPLQVEPVAWVTARKDLLGLSFGLLAVWLYVSSARRMNAARYAALTAAFGLSLMAKPMMITLPFILVLLDFWPLAQFESELVMSRLKKSVSAKWLLFLVAILYAPVPLLGQPTAFSGSTTATWAEALFTKNVFYLGKILFPAGLGIYGPAPRAELAVGEIVASALAIVGMTWLAARSARSKPYLLVGWLWFLGTLTPVMESPHPADRFMYVPMIGPLMALVWLASDLLERLRVHRAASAALSLGAISALAILSHAQAAHWRDDPSVVARALSVNEKNYLAHNKRGALLDLEGRYEEAKQHFERAIELRPLYWEPMNNIGVSLQKRGRHAEAIPYFQRALALKPDFALAHFNWGVTLIQLRNYEEAVRRLEETIRLRPDFVKARFYLGMSYYELGEYQAAESHLSETLRLAPGHAQARTYLSLIAGFGSAAVGSRFNR